MQMTDGFKAMYPRSVALGLSPASNGDGIQFGGFDQEEVEKALGEDRFQKLMAGVKHVFSCGHRVGDDGAEIHCIYAHDLESFLQAGG